MQNSKEAIWIYHQIKSSVTWNSTQGIYLWVLFGSHSKQKQFLLNIINLLISVMEDVICFLIGRNRIFKCYMDQLPASKN